MSEEIMTQEAPVSNDGGTVDQSSYVSDMWNDNYFHTHEAELTPEQAAQKQAQAPKAKVDEVKTEQKPQAETPKKPDEKQPVKQESQPSRFEQAFRGEDGEIDVDKFLSFNIPEADNHPLQADIGTPEPDNAPKLEQWQQDQQEVEKLQASLSSELLDPLNKAYNLISQGTNPVQALKAVYDERKAFIDQHVNEVKNQKEFQRQKALEERLLGDTKAKAQAQQSAVNTNEIISSLPGDDISAKTELFNEVLFGTEGGAKLMDYYFREKVEGVDKMTPQQKHAAAVKFVNEVTSNKAKLRFMFNQALALQTRNNLPKILQKARLGAVAQHKSNAVSAQKNPTGTSKRTAPAASKNQWDSYLVSHYDAADRV